MEKAHQCVKDLTMRLHPDDKTAILLTTKEVFGADATVRLFGSRVDDSKRGGDIDLYVEVPGHLDDGFSKELELNSVLQSRIGEQKIDIVARGSEDEIKPIHQAALSTGVKL